MRSGTSIAFSAAFPGFVRKLQKDTEHQAKAQLFALVPPVRTRPIQRAIADGSHTFIPL
jgi:hypothetical protein